MRKSLIGNIRLARGKPYLWAAVALAIGSIGSASAGTQKTCNDKAIEHIRAAWFALNTFVVDNKGRTSKDQSFSYADLGHVVYDVGQMVHVFDGVDCYKAVEFLVELKSYSIADAAIGEELSAMIRRRPGDANKAAKVFLGQAVSPCLRWYEGSQGDLLNRPSAYCANPAYWKELLQGYISK